MSAQSPAITVPVATSEDGVAVDTPLEVAIPVSGDVPAVGDDCVLTDRNVLVKCRMANWDETALLVEVPVQGYLAPDPRVGCQPLGSFAWPVMPSDGSRFYALSDDTAVYDTWDAQGYLSISATDWDSKVLAPVKSFSASRTGIPQYAKKYGYYRSRGLNFPNANISNFPRFLLSRLSAFYDPGTRTVSVLPPGNMTGLTIRRTGTETTESGTTQVSDSVSPAQGDYAVWTLAADVVSASYTFTVDNIVLNGVTWYGPGHDIPAGASYPAAANPAVFLSIPDASDAAFKDIDYREASGLARADSMLVASTGEVAGQLTIRTYPLNTSIHVKWGKAYTVGDVVNDDSGNPRPPTEIPAGGAILDKLFAGDTLSIVLHGPEGDKLFHVEIPEPCYDNRFYFFRAYIHSYQPPAQVPVSFDMPDLRGWFASPGASGDGTTKETPGDMATVIGLANTTAASVRPKVVHCQMGTYDLTGLSSNLTVGSNVSVYGGYDASWRRDAYSNRTYLSFGTGVELTVDAPGSLIDGFWSRFIANGNSHYAMGFTGGRYRANNCRFEDLIMDYADYSGPHTWSFPFVSSSGSGNFSGFHMDKMSMGGNAEAILFESHTFYGDINIYSLSMSTSDNIPPGYYYNSAYIVRFLGKISVNEMTVTGFNGDPAISPNPTGSCIGGSIPIIDFSSINVHDYFSVKRALFGNCCNAGGSMANARDGYIGADGRVVAPGICETGVAGLRGGTGAISITERIVISNSFNGGRVMGRGGNGVAPGVSGGSVTNRGAGSISLLMGNNATFRINDSFNVGDSVTSGGAGGPGAAGGRVLLSNSSVLGIGLIDTGTPFRLTGSIINSFNKGNHTGSGGNGGDGVDGEYGYWGGIGGSGEIANRSYGIFSSAATSFGYLFSEMEIDAVNSFQGPAGGFNGGDGGAYGGSGGQSVGGLRGQPGSPRQEATYHCVANTFATIPTHGCRCIGFDRIIHTLGTTPPDVDPIYNKTSYGTQRSPDGSLPWFSGDRVHNESLDGTGGRGAPIDGHESPGGPTAPFPDYCGDYWQLAMTP